MKQVKRALLVLATLALASCGTASLGSSSSSISSSSNSSVEETSEAISSSEVSSSSIEVSSSEEKSVFIVTFYDGENVLYSFSVKEGETVERPEDPVKVDHDFLGWYSDKGLTQEYDFSSPISSATSIYACFMPRDYFKGYNGKFLPSYSPLVSNQSFYQDEKDVTLVLRSSSVSLTFGITANMIRLFGAFEGLEIVSISLDDNVLSIQTVGSLSLGIGYIGLAKEASDAGVYLTASIEVKERYAEIDASSYRTLNENKNIDFTIAMKNIVLNNPDNLSKKDYMAKVNSKEITYFSVTPEDRYSLVELFEISDDWTAFRFRLGLPEALNEDIAKELAETVKIHVAAEALSNGVAQDFTIDLLHAKTKSSVTLFRTSATSYGGVAKIKLESCRLTSAFVNNLEKLAQEPKNQNLIITFPDVSTSIIGLKKIDETTFEARFKIDATTLPEGKATIYLDQVQVDDENPEKTNYIAKDWYAGHGITPEREYVEYVVDQNADAGGGTGTVNQNYSQSYRFVKSEVEQSAFYDVSEEVSNDADAIIKGATNIGKIGYGLYSGDFSMAKDGAGGLFGITSMLDPSSQILSSLASISEKLLEIEAKIDSIASSLETIQAEIEQLGQQSLLNNFLNASANWKAFVTDYYIPLKDAVVSYSNDYFRYFYNIVIDSFDPFPGEEPKVTLYYDNEGNLAMPGRNRSLSIDGKPINKAATKTVIIPTLHHALNGVFANSGHVYAEIEEDLIADLFSYGIYDEALIRDIVSTLRYNAMKGHFQLDSEIDKFTLTFSNFCTAFSSSEFGSSLQAAITPLDSYRIMLETIYNFGFEIEPEFNLVVVKIESTYYCARSILGLVKFINSGEIVSSRYDDLDKAVKKEFTDTRFYHPNIDSKTIYSYAYGGYLNYNCDAYGIAVDIDYDYDDGMDIDTYVNRGEYYSVDNHSKPGSVVSIDEATIRLMALKVKLYNNLKGTTLGFKEYLYQIGLIPEDKLEFTLGVIIKVDGFQNGWDNVNGLRYPSGWKLENGHSFDYAFKGKAFSFADGDVVNGLCAITGKWMATSLGSYVGPGELTNVGVVDVQSYIRFGVYAYYLNFLPANLE